MSEKPTQRRVSFNRKMKPQKLSRRVVLIRPSPKNPIKFIKRCNSEPALPTVDQLIDVGGGSVDDHGGVIVRRRAFADVFWSSPDLVLRNSSKKVEVIETRNDQLKFNLILYMSINRL